MTDTYYDELHPRSLHITAIEFDVFICHLAHELYPDQQQEEDEEDQEPPQRLTSVQKIDELVSVLHRLLGPKVIKVDCN